MKNILSLILAIAMMLSMTTMGMAVPGGDEIGGAVGATDLGGSVEVPQVYMTMPVFSNKTIIFDIYDQLETGKQVISSELTFINHSVVPVELKLKSYTASTSSADAIVASTDPTAFEGDAVGTDKKMLLWLNVAEKDSFQDKTDAEDNRTYPEYLETAHNAQVITAYGTGGIAGTPVEPTNLVLGKMLRGTKAVRQLDGTVEREDFPVDVVLGTRNAMTLKFEGLMNDKATWTADEIIKVTPVFEFVPVKFDVEEEGGSSGGGLQLTTSSPISVAAATGMGAGSPVVITVVPAGSFKTTGWAIGDILVTTANGKTYAVSGAPTLSGDNLTIKLKCGTAAVGDVVTIAVKPSGFVTPPAENVVLADITVVA